MAVECFAAMLFVSDFLQVGFFGERPRGGGCMAALYSEFQVRDMFFSIQNGPKKNLKRQTMIFFLKFWGFIYNQSAIPGE